MRGLPGLAASLLLVGFAGSASGAAPRPSPTPASYVLVQTDGSTVRLVKAPERKGKNLVGNLWPSGQLVSIPAEKVDEGKTAAANAGGRGSAPPPEKSIGTRYKPAGPQAPLGDKVKLKGGRKNVERTLQGTPTPTPTRTKTPPPSGED